jgi:hypothetical protein
MSYFCKRFRLKCRQRAPKALRNTSRWASAILEVHLRPARVDQPSPSAGSLPRGCGALLEFGDRLGISRPVRFPNSTPMVRVTLHPLGLLEASLVSPKGDFVTAAHVLQDMKKGEPPFPSPQSFSLSVAGAPKREKSLRFGSLFNPPTA